MACGRSVRTPARGGAWVAALLAALLVGGCSSSASPNLARPSASATSGRTPASGGAGPSGSASPSAATSTPPAKGTVKVTGTVATGLSAPWGLVQLPDGTLLVGARDTGRISRVDPKTHSVTQIGLVPGVTHTKGGENGLLGLAISPDYGSDHLVYAYFSTESDNRIASFLYDPSRPKGEQLGAPDTILRGIPTGTLHNGGRIAFGPDGDLYAGTGETGQRALAQNMSSLGGKILRMTPDGQVPSDNPTPGSLVYSPGHRNVQGLAWDAQGRLWASEFGQDTWDELNLIRPGANYGWPTVEGIAHHPGFVDPVEQWHTDVASPSGVAYAAGCIWMASLKGERLWRIPLAGAKPSAAPQSFLNGKYGRLRTVVALDDHTLLLTTSNTDDRGTPHPGDDRILQLTVS
ncbi:Glucose/arabinose dehydrogenase, beta-propeller fold [Actinacidiphila yanglinensis]|uniref:Glucose/arabinose dehydrogenase, beta-propeller fold n=1 Tax=Actinacidiphila yanglinensis TaxID=310779 RepID=A0A1H5WBN1_9ACTN|nr:PQQ-dependent sugar dehydrogenase [Actinacidiphila yanglinensis]SEF96803.1 Glucose/arabinose dehydrogenase, beta-propeller fold [Actinacidiphila yanglinensis]